MKRREFVKFAGLLTAGATLAAHGVPVDVERSGWDTETYSPTTPDVWGSEDWVGVVTAVTATSITISYGSHITMDLTGDINFGHSHGFKLGDRIRIQGVPVPRGLFIDGQDLTKIPSYDWSVS